ncbi:hypothetical protein A8F94_17990 [Bacillus sp. FJAT-27225]|uniref:hypothetical protein n=1 Tax=Bacillus sp. FJAT-27225 TaxID=1743144 RepID=UPI00080C27D2|nr:hypothetical protein [Bacillus sp. FJAT-27225]OCA83036.1 hypothetical protein A8F94_17990 [Bacillus sp. FJAT-27225]
MDQLLKNVTVVLSLMAAIYGGLSLIPFGPPALSVTAGEQSVSAARGSFCWEGYISSKCEDTLSPPELVKVHNLKPIVVSPGEEVNIAFKKVPLTDTVGVSRWVSEIDAKAASLNGNILIAPLEKGVYIYSIYGSWEKGSSGYAFVIEVK